MAEFQDNRSSGPKHGLTDVLVWGAVLTACTGLAWLLTSGINLSIEGARRAGSDLKAAVERMETAGREAETPRTCDLTEAELADLPVAAFKSAGEGSNPPRWRSRAMPEYPRSAWSQGVESGYAVISCVSMPDGRLAHCQAVEESPPGAGFGPAAVAAACEAATEPMTTDGRTEASTIRFTVRFATRP